MTINYPSNMNVIIIYFALLCLIEGFVNQKYLSYVCNSFSNYQTTRASNPKCHYSSRVFGLFEEIAQNHGYNTDAFDVVTEDFYILTLFRISSKQNTSAGSPVLLAHGCLTSATAYTIAGNHSLVVLLAEAGYDVWVINFRGNSYSDRHLFFNSDDKNFWDFSFHEYGIYDLKAIIDFVTSTTEQKVIFFGWSLASRAYFAYNTMLPDEAIQKVRVSISLAPTIYLHLMKTLIIKVVEIIPFLLLKGALDTLFPKGVFYQKTSSMVKSVIHLCFDNPAQVLMCEFAKDLATGFDVRQESPEYFPALLAQSSEATSLKLAYHTVQLAKSKKFQQFDYGRVTNLKRYGTPHPPLYNISLINVPIHFIYGPNDFLAPEEIAKLVYQQLSEVAKPFGEPYGVKYKTFCHTDMVASKDIKTLLNDPIIEFLKSNQADFNN